MTPALTIGIAGGTCAGKTTLANLFVGHLGADNCVLVGLDEFYKQQSDEALATGAANFDLPEAFDFEAFVTAVATLRRGRDAIVPRYDRSISQIAGETTILARPVLIVEGLYALWDRRVVEMLDLAVFLEIDPTLQLQRRLHRDVDEYGRSEDGARRRYANQVTPAFIQHIEPTRANAHLALSGKADPEGCLKTCLAFLEQKAR